MEVSNQIQLKFHSVDFPVINLNSDKPFFQREENTINIDITPKVFYPKDQADYFKIIQEIKLSSDKYFSLFILAVGTFELKASLDEKIRKSFININAPAIMFPYIRSFISTLTANLGNVTGPLTIPTQFFKGELEEISDIPQ
ncbi:MAG: protein-export chaperone SecB [Limnohabitans sp.]|nr:protein-export chaperone SecB [Limnohabitans sp.]